MSQDTLTVRFLRGTGLGGGGVANPGDVVNLPVAQARLYLLNGRAVAVPQVDEVLPTAPGEIETQEPPIENRDPAPRRGGRRRL